MKPNNNIAPLSETPALNTPANAGLGLDIHFSGIGGNLIYNTMIKFTWILMATTLVALTSIAIYKFCNELYFAGLETFIILFYSIGIYLIKTEDDKN